MVTIITPKTDPYMLTKNQRFKTKSLFEENIIKTIIKDKHLLQPYKNKIIEIWRKEPFIYKNEKFIEVYAICNAYRQQKYGAGFNLSFIITEKGYKLLEKTAI